jgi:acyl transferase domain-containing protein/acyl carrier protein
MESAYDANGSEIAIIGMAGRFPGANTIDQFWQNLRDGVESITFLADDQIEPSSIDPIARNDPNYVRAAAILDDIEHFDAAFFGFAPQEAALIDPQQRIFLECAWEALERAGYDPATYPGAIGVYAGARTNTYLLNLFSHPDLFATLGSFQVGLGNDLAFLTTRVAYKLNLRGPSYAVQTACSTSLVAVHLACQSLLIDECQIALAGGIAINVPHKTGYLYRPGGIFSPDGHCRAFDAQAQGTIFGSGVGIVVLKRLEDALADGDTIHAIIKGSAVNNDGALKASFTAPSVQSQAAVIADALFNAEVAADSISYVEAHGTGTALGDPIEIRALTKAFQAGTDRKGFCAIGSVKTNLGHLDTAAGIASLIKTVLALENQQLPPSLHYQTPNPQIDFANSPFYVNRRLAAWPAREAPRRAGVSAFGIGGANAHIVLEEAPPPTPTPPARDWQLLLLSAKTATALDSATVNLARHMQAHPGLNLADVAYTLQVGRQAWDHRRMLVCRDHADALQLLGGRDPQRVFSEIQEIGGRPVAFMFPGQGTQYITMAAGLYQDQPTFRQHVEQCAELLAPQLGRDIREIIYPMTNDERRTTNAAAAPSSFALRPASDAADLLDQTWLTQPALFVIEYALAQLWMSWGIKPQALIGHSLGEYVAACLSGVFALEDALLLVAARGRLMQQLPPGAMLAVPLTEEALQPLLGAELAIAAINAPALCVVSGPATAIAALEQQLAAASVTCRRLRSAHAFHSAMIAPILDEFVACVSRVPLSPPQIPYLSNVTGRWITADEATDPGYWARQLRQTVRFADGVHELLKNPEQVLLEVGPGHTLSQLVRQHPASGPEHGLFTSLRHWDEAQPDRAFVLTALGKLWLNGVAVDWPSVHADEQRRRLVLPTYPFERQRHWIAPGEPAGAAGIRQNGTGARADIADWFYIPSWKRTMPPRRPAQRNGAAQRRSWLIFADACGVGAALAQRLMPHDQAVVVVQPGEQFGHMRENVYMLVPQRREDYNRLFQELRTLDKIPQVIIHAWSVTPDVSAQAEPDSFAQAQTAGFYSLLYLTQALGEQNSADPVHIALLSNNLQRVTGEEVVYPEKATILGPCRVIPREYPYITCQSIDIIVPQPENIQESWVIDYLMADIDAPSADSVIAYRNNQRWVQCFEPTQLDSAGNPHEALRQNGVYLITGGLGGVGLVLARYLANAVHARLILVGRTPLPAREHWQQRLDDHDQHERVSHKIRTVQQLEALGAEVLVCCADVAEPEQMRIVVEQSIARFGTLHGVIHAAGVSGGGLIQLKTPEIAEDIMRPKVRGLLVLDALLRDVKLDFLVLFSSISAILGELGQIDYCAANAFLDAFADRFSARTGINAMSINWDTWKETGMALAAAEDSAMPAALRELLQEAIAYGIASSEGAEAFCRIVLENSVPQIIVSTRDLQQRISDAVILTQSHIFEALQRDQSTNVRHPRAKVRTPYVAARTLVEQGIVEIWQQILGIEEVGVNDDFFDLGGHSLMAIMLAGRLRDRFQLDISLSKIFEAPTVAKLAQIIEEIQLEPDDREEIELLHMLSQLSEEEVEIEITKRMNPEGF